MPEPFADAKVGDRVWSPDNEWGTIDSFYLLQEKTFHVSFDNGYSRPYKTTSKTLYHSEMQVVPALTWRDEPPDVEGWWWHWDHDGSIEVVWVYNEDGEWKSLSGVYLGFPRHQWAGPLPVPGEAIVDNETAPDDT